jgi:hypothetical protein
VRHARVTLPQHGDLGLSVDLDLFCHELDVDRGNVDVSGIDNGDGVEVRVHVGGALGVDDILMQERGRRLEYRR